MYFIVSPIAANFFYNSLTVVGQTIDLKQVTTGGDDSPSNPEELYDLRAAAMQLNSLFYSLIKEITAQESQIFYSHFSQISFVCEGL